MFIQIKKERFRESSISRYIDKGKSVITNKWYIDCKISGQWVSFCFDTEEEYKGTLTYLDKVLNVKVV